MNNKRRTTISGYNHKVGRMEGNTTRQIDLAIQILFEDGEVKAEDHWDEGKNRNANNHLFERILKRLQFEHPRILDKYVEVDTSRFIISLNK